MHRWFCYTIFEYSYVAFDEKNKIKAQKLKKVKLNEALAAFKIIFPDTPISPDSLKEKLYTKTPQLTTKLHLKLEFSPY